MKKHSYDLSRAFGGLVADVSALVALSEEDLRRGCGYELAGVSKRAFYAERRRRGIEAAKSPLRMSSSRRELQTSVSLPKHSSEVGADRRRRELLQSFLRLRSHGHLARWVVPEAVGVGEFDGVISCFFMTYVVGRELVRLGVDPSSRSISWRSRFSTDTFWALLERRSAYVRSRPSLCSALACLHCHNVLLRFDTSYSRLKKLVVKWLGAGVDSVEVVRLVSLVAVFSGGGTLSALEKLAPGDLPVVGTSSNLLAEEQARGRVCLCCFDLLRGDCFRGECCGERVAAAVFGSLSLAVLQCCEARSAFFVTVVARGFLSMLAVVRFVAVLLTLFCLSLFLPVFGALVGGPKG